LKNSEPKTKARRPLEKNVGVEFRLLVAHHYDGRFTDIHIEAFFTKYLNVGQGYGFVTYLEGLIPRLGVSIRSDAHIALDICGWDRLSARHLMHQSIWRFG
jgi:hypothetical protein